MEARVLRAEIERGLFDFFHRMPKTNAQFWDILEFHYGSSFRQNPDGEILSGKRLRPLFVLLGAHAVSGSYSRALPVALSLEMIHDFTLILDDIMDEDHLRRARPTAWTKFGVNKSVTTATGLYTLAYRSILDYLGQEKETGPIVMEQIIRACLETHDAQLLDLAFENTFDVSEPDCIETAYGRSSLIACAPEIGAIIAGASEDVCRSFSSFGRNFAIAYSIYDDYMDIWAEEYEIGKPVASDLRQKKKSYPVVMAYAMASAEQRNLMEQFYLPGKPGEDEIAMMSELITRTGSRSRTEQIIIAYLDAALRDLEQTGPDNEARRLLRDIVMECFQKSACFRIPLIGSALKVY